MINCRYIKYKKKNLHVTYNDKLINFVKEYTYLGNILDNHLNLGKNFEKSYKRAAGRVKLLSSIRKYLTVNAATRIYIMMIMPILTYSGTVKLTYTKTQLQKWKRFQNRANKVTGATVPDIMNALQRESCVLVKKCLEGTLRNVAFKDYFKFSKSKTRNNSKLIILPKIKLEIARGSFYFGGAKHFNALPLQIRAISSFETFKCLVKNHFT